MLPRLHLFEIEDQPWCPDWLRNIMTGYLRTVNRTLRPYRFAAEPLAELLERSGSNQVLDLCSGSGGPWPELAEELEQLGHKTEVVCSDLYPDQAMRSLLESVANVSMHPDPVCATRVPAELVGTRTLFTALHHFDPDEVRAMLNDAQAAGRHFAAFEITHRSVKGLLATFMTPIMALLLLPSVRPRRFVPLLLSYLPPLVPLAIAWDGTVSTLRSYRAEELREMVATLDNDDYHWRVEERSSGTPLPMTSILGWPVVAQPKTVDSQG